MVTWSVLVSDKKTSCENWKCWRFRFETLDCTLQNEEWLREWWCQSNQKDDDISMDSATFQIWRYFTNKSIGKMKRICFVCSQRTAVAHFPLRYQGHCIQREGGTPPSTLWISGCKCTQNGEWNGIYKERRYLHLCWKYSDHNSICDGLIYWFVTFSSNNWLLIIRPVDGQHIGNCFISIRHWYWKKKIRAMTLDFWERTAAAARRHAKRRTCSWRIVKCFTTSYQKHHERACVLNRNSWSLRKWLFVIHESTF